MKNYSCPTNSYPSFSWLGSLLKIYFLSWYLFCSFWLRLPRSGIPFQDFNLLACINAAGVHIRDHSIRFRVTS